MAKIDPAVLAEIQARQNYQQKLDSYTDAEEKRLQRKAQLGKQALWGGLSFIVVLAIVALLQLPFDNLFVFYILAFMGVMELLLIVGYLFSLRPNKMPEEAQ